MRVLKSISVDNSLAMQLMHADYYEDIYLAIDSSRKEMGAFLNWVPLNQSAKDVENYFKDKLDPLPFAIEIPYCIFYKKELVGVISLMPLARIHKTLEMGYWLKTSATGNGIITKCAKQLTSYAFYKLQANQVLIRCSSTNAKSQKIPERLGYKNVGIDRQAVEIDGHYHEVINYSKLQEEWTN